MKNPVVLKNNPKKKKKKIQKCIKTKEASKLVIFSNLTTSKSANVCQQLSHERSDVEMPSQSVIYRFTIKEAEENSILRLLHFTVNEFIANNMLVLKRGVVKLESLHQPNEKGHNVMK